MKSWTCDDYRRKMIRLYCRTILICGFVLTIPPDLKSHHGYDTMQWPDYVWINVVLLLVADLVLFIKRCYGFVMTNIPYSINIDETFIVVELHCLCWSYKKTFRKGSYCISLKENRLCLSNPTIALGRVHLGENHFGITFWSEDDVQQITSCLESYGWTINK